MAEQCLDAAMTQEQRIDPDDGKPYTFTELSEYNKGVHPKKAIDDYWANECKPIRSQGKSEAKAQVNAMLPVNAFDTIAQHKEPICDPNACIARQLLDYKMWLGNRVGADEGERRCDMESVGTSNAGVFCGSEGMGCDGWTFRGTMKILLSVALTPGEKLMTGVYEGRVNQNNEPDGKGIFTCRSKRHSVVIRTRWTDGLPVPMEGIVGQTRLPEIPDIGDVAGATMEFMVLDTTNPMQSWTYSGGMNNKGQPQGWGKKTLQDGSTVIAQWNNGDLVATPKARTIDTRGRVCLGGLGADGRRHGRCLLYYFDDEKNFEKMVNQTWSNKKPDLSKPIIIRKADGSKYEGYLNANGKKHSWAPDGKHVPSKMTTKHGEEKWITYNNGVQGKESLAPIQEIQEDTPSASHTSDAMENLFHQIE